MKEISCIYCDSHTFLKKGNKGYFKILECKKCGLGFVHPLPSNHEIEKIYSIMKISKDLKKNIRNSIYDFEHNPNNPKRAWFSKILNITKNYVNKDKLDILELGSAYGYFINYANINGHNAVGIEVIEEYAFSVTVIEWDSLFLNTVVVV